MRSIILVAHNIRSAHNVGSLLRTADGLGVTKVFLTGYSPHPQHVNDVRLPYLAEKIAKQINKTALGAENSVDWEFSAEINPIIQKLKSGGNVIAALEQAKGSTSLPDFSPPDQLAIIIGREVEGIEPEVLAMADEIVEIPMLGQKESLNVAQAAAIALYYCRYIKN